MLDKKLDEYVTRVENDAYELGISVGKSQERERIVELVEHWLVNDEQHIPRLCGGCEFVARIKGETNE